MPCPRIFTIKRKHAFELVKTILIAKFNKVRSFEILSAHTQQRIERLQQLPFRLHYYPSGVFKCINF